MTTKPVLNLSHGSVSASSTENKMKAGLAILFQQALLPHLAAGMGLLLVSMYVGYTLWLTPLSLSPVLLFVLIGLLLVILGIVGMGYSLLAACIFALYEACSAWEDFIDHMLVCVQDKAIASLNSLDEGLAKDQAKVLIRGSVQDVFHTLRKQEFSAWPRWLTAICLGLLTLAMRSVLIARIVKWSGTTIKISKIFAGKATLVGAIFLNLRFFVLLLLGSIYAVGGIVLFVNAFLLWWVK